MNCVLDSYYRVVVEGGKNRFTVLMVEEVSDEFGMFMFWQTPSCHIFNFSSKQRSVVYQFVRQCFGLKQAPLPLFTCAVRVTRR